MRQTTRGAVDISRWGATPSLTEHFDLGVDGNVAALHWAGVDALVVMGDVSDLKTAVGEQVDSGIC